MKLKNLIIIALAGVVLAACSVEARPARAVFSLPGISVEGGGGGNFCPPGQAKKGNC